MTYPYCSTPQRGNERKAMYSDCELEYKGRLVSPTQSKMGSRDILGAECGVFHISGVNEAPLVFMFLPATRLRLPNQTMEYEQEQDAPVHLYHFDKKTPLLASPGKNRLF